MRVERTTATELAPRSAVEPSPFAPNQQGIVVRPRVWPGREQVNPVPEGYLSPDENLPIRSLLRGSVYWIREDRSRATRECRRYVFRETDGGFVLERRYQTTYDNGAIYEWREFWELGGHAPPTSHFAWAADYCVIRRGRDSSGFGSSRVPLTHWPFQFVHLTDTRVDWVEAVDVLGYHPDVVHSWYRTAEACETAKNAGARATWE